MHKAIQKRASPVLLSYSWQHRLVEPKKRKDEFSKMAHSKIRTMPQPKYSNYFVNMFAYLHGQLSHVEPTFCILDVNGVGYHLSISVNTFNEIKSGINQKIKLFVSPIIREDTFDLYGFFDRAEKNMFLHLISVSGVGPSTARIVLSTYQAEEIAMAIRTENISMLKSIKGIGPKAAQRLIIDLKEKMSKIDLDNTGPVDSSNNVKKQALDALQALGFSKGPAEKALVKVAQENNEELTTEKLIKHALKIL